MRIKVKSKDRNFNLWLPTRLFLNPLSVAICTKIINNKPAVATGSKISYFAVRKLFKVIRKSRHILQGQPLVSVNSVDGEVVEIWI